MSSVKISQLPEASMLAGTELLPAVQSGQTVGASVAQIRAGLLSSAHAGSGGAAHSTASPGGEAGFMSGADKAKLNGIQASATANSTDAALRDRATHTGSQPHTTITGLGTMATQSASAYAALSGAAFSGNISVVQSAQTRVTLEGGTANTHGALVVFQSRAAGQPGSAGHALGTSNAIVGGTDQALMLFVEGDRACRVWVNGGTKLEITSTGIVPGVDNAISVGSGARRYDQAYVATGVINTSDRRDKEMISPIDAALAAALVRAFDPVTFKWRDIDRPAVTETRRSLRQKTGTVPVSRDVIERVGDRFVRRRVEETMEQPLFVEHPLYDEAGNPLTDGEGQPILYREPVMEEVEEEVVTATAYQKTNIRTHWGFIAQQVEQGLCTALGLDPADPDQRDQARRRFAGLIHDSAADRYGLREGQFIPILWATLRNLLDRVERLETAPSPA